MPDDPEQEKEQEDVGQNPGADENIDPNPEMESDAKGNEEPMPRHEEANDNLM